MTSLLVRGSISILGALLLCSLLFYGYLAGLIGSPSDYAKWLVPVFFYTGLCLSCAGVLFVFLNWPAWARISFIWSALMVMMLALFLIFIEPTLQRMKTHSLIQNLQQLYQQYSLEKLNCEDGYQVHLSKIEQRPAEVVLFQPDNYEQQPQRLAGWDKASSSNSCRFVENTYLLGTQRMFFSRCQNEQQNSVTELIAQAKRMDCVS